MAFKPPVSQLNNFAEKTARFKDYGISKGGEYLLRRYLRDFGQVNSLQVDTRNRSVECEVLLNGESEPLRAELRQYAVEHEGDKSFISFREVTASKEWVNALAEKFFAGRRFEIPEEYAALLKKML
ncbi:MAG: hypothetical protein ACLFMP_02590 [Desulfonatronovibrionaceae bacterium]